MKQSQTLCAIVAGVLLAAGLVTSSQGADPPGLDRRIAPPAGYSGPLFELSYDFPATASPEPRPWEAIDFRTQPAAYMNTLLAYVLEGQDRDVARAGQCDAQMVPHAVDGAGRERPRIYARSHIRTALTGRRIGTSADEMPTELGGRLLQSHRHRHAAPRLVAGKDRRRTRSGEHNICAGDRRRETPLHRDHIGRGADRGGRAHCRCEHLCRRRSR